MNDYDLFSRSFIWLLKTQHISP